MIDVGLNKNSGICLEVGERVGCSFYFMLIIVYFVVWERYICYVDSVYC